MKKILYMTNLPVPYKIDFFNELGRNMNLTVVFERRTASDREVFLISMPCLWMAKNMEMRLPFVLKFVR